ncbi:MAG: aminotransferase class IV [Clostridia bacterium]|jgi:branched-subunit amino acid aminotransferase/4-amino-4-deoxychorismate lyase|nr:aminotransferase class IV [Clostridia bacterium]MDH7573803.1 aminotransferase class IV [Clostridia bacterium]
MGWVWVNGRLLGEAEAAVPAGDPGFLYGEGLFETLAVCRGRPVLLDRHLERLAASAAWLGLPCPDRGMWLRALEEVTAANQVDEGWARLVLTRGAGRGLAIAAAGSGRRYPEEDYRRGWRAIISSYRQDQTSPLCRLKTLNYLPHLLARREARERGADEGLHLNLAGEVAEGAYSNVFLLREGELVTPPPESGLLPGITRAAVMELGVELGLVVRERPVRPEEFTEAEEAFLTSSLAWIMPLVEVEGRSIGSGRPGPITLALGRAYRRRVEEG